MTRERILAAAIALTLIPLAANAQGGGTFTVRGVGLDSCGAWSENRRAPADPQHGWPRQVEESWVLGYVSSFDEHALVPLGRIDSAALLARVDDYCAGHPEDSVQQASDSLIQDLLRRAAAPR